LSATFASDRAALQLALSPHRGGGASRPLIVHRPSGKRPLVLDIIAVTAGDLALPTRTRSIVVVNDLGRRQQVCRNTLQHAFDLTPRETDLAACLADGATLRAAAAELGISEMHARQRLKVLFAKTDTSRQTELATLLARLA
jgi:DNA-binding CsgD family transcriptional regulator